MESNTTVASFNETLLHSNVTLEEIVNFLNLNITNVTNESEETKVQLFDLYEVYKSAERDRLVIYKSVAYVLGTLIILSNLIVVISSGLILKKGQQPKSTYLLLGNVSLADTIIGLSIIFGAVADNANSSNWLCVFQIGMIVCPTMVSIFSVGLIAVDRYIYILHGLYYQRWFNTTRVRIGIIIIWVVGIIIGLVPITGWKNKENSLLKCHYFALYPDPVILFNCIIKILVIVSIAVLYTIILTKAIKNVKAINALKQFHNYNSNNNDSTPSLAKLKIFSKRKTEDIVSQDATTKDENSSSVIDTVIPDKACQNHVVKCSNYISKSISVSKPKSETIHSTLNENSSKHDVAVTQATMEEQTRIIHKSKEPSVWRAIIVVFLTTGSLMLNYLPFFILAVVYVMCKHKSHYQQCLHVTEILAGPFSILVFFNSLLNPLIYAWWHKGFKEAVKNMFRKYIRKQYSSRCIK